jgi:glyoxylase-like metal-dependent hydrolase (beta-lactamase superfamily II)
VRVWSIASPVSIEGARTTYNFFSYVTVLEAGEPKSGTGLARAFHENGLDPLSVTIVFHSHIHIDHFGGNRLFTRAQKLMSREELLDERRWNGDFFEARDKAAFLAARFPHLSSVESEKIADMLLAGQSKYFKDEILGEPGLFRFFEDGPGLEDRNGLHRPGLVDFIRIIPTPGHTPHHLSFAILGRRGAAIVTGDLFHARKSFYGETDGFIEVYSDREEAAVSRARINRLGEELGDPVICPAHDRPFRFRSGSYLRRNPWSIDG